VVELSDMPAIAINKKAKFDYEMMETLSAGLVLSGPEVKSAKAGQVSLKGAFVVLKQRPGRLPEAYLLNATITPYKFAIPGSLDSTRSRKLLLTKKELGQLVGKTAQEGLTLVPLSLYTKNGLVKLDFAIARGKKKYDKREDIKKRDVKRQLQRLMKR